MLRLLIQSINFCFIPHLGAIWCTDSIFSFNGIRQQVLFILWVSNWYRVWNIIFVFLCLVWCSNFGFHRLACILACLCFCYSFGDRCIPGGVCDICAVIWCLVKWIIFPGRAIFTDYFFSVIFSIRLGHLARIVYSFWLRSIFWISFRLFSATVGFSLIGFLWLVWGD